MPDDSKVSKFMEGIGKPEPFQLITDVKPGDPQFSALNQFISGKINLAESDVIVDFGSGGGVLAHVLDQVWQGKPSPPCYVAVDHDAILKALSIPTKIHNNSVKISVAEFLNGWLSKTKKHVAVVVIRNVMHELSISEAANLLLVLLKQLPDDAEIYIQDMQSLPRAERNRAGWHADLLSNALNKIGFDANMFQQQSHSGIPWFVLNVKIRERRAELGDVLAECITARREQQKRVISALSKSTLEDVEYIRLQSDSSALAFLLSSETSIEGALSYPLKAIGIQTIPAQQFGPADFAEETPEQVKVASGISAMLSRKSIINFPSHFAKCQTRALFLGLSLRKFFTDDSSMSLCERLVFKAKGCVKLVMCDPASPFALLRSAEPAYGSNTSIFQAELAESIVEAKKFYKTLVQKCGEPTSDMFDIRISSKIAYSSFVIIDDSAFISHYSSYLTGSNGLCYVLEDGPKIRNSGLKHLEADFHLACLLSSSIIH